MEKIRDILTLPHLASRDYKNFDFEGIDIRMYRANPPGPRIETAYQVWAVSEALDFEGSADLLMQGLANTLRAARGEELLLMPDSGDDFVVFERIKDPERLAIRVLQMYEEMLQENPDIARPEPWVRQSIDELRNLGFAEPSL